MTNRAGLAGGLPLDLGPVPEPTALHWVDQADCVARFEAVLDSKPMGVASGDEIAMILVGAVATQSKACDAAFDIVEERHAVPRDATVGLGDNEVSKLAALQPVTGVVSLVESPGPVQPSKGVPPGPVSRARPGEDLVVVPGFADFHRQSAVTRGAAQRQSGPETELSLQVDTLPAASRLQLQRGDTRSDDSPNFSPAAEEVKVTASDVRPASEPMPMAHWLKRAQTAMGKPDTPESTSLYPAAVTASRPEPETTQGQTEWHTASAALSRTQFNSEALFSAIPVIEPASVPMPVAVRMSVPMPMPMPMALTDSPQRPSVTADEPRAPESGLTDRVRENDPVAISKSEPEIPVSSAWSPPARLDFSQGDIQEPTSPSVRVVRELSDLLKAAVTRLESGPSASGATQVRLEFKADFLPGVTAVLQQAGSRIQVDFFCAGEASLQLLSTITRREASDVARRCRRDVLLRIHSHDEEQTESVSVLEILGAA